LKNVHELINYCWQAAKMMFEDDANFKRMNQIANETIKNTPEGKERKFVKAMMLAILEYIEDVWREKKNKGI